MTEESFMVGAERLGRAFGRALSYTLVLSPFVVVVFGVLANSWPSVRTILGSWLVLWTVQSYRQIAREMDIEKAPRP